MMQQAPPENLWHIALTVVSLLQGAVTLLLVLRLWVIVKGVDGTPGKLRVLTHHDRADLESADANLDNKVRMLKEDVTEIKADMHTIADWIRNQAQSSFKLISDK